MKKLYTPLLYLKIKHKHKLKYDLFVPLTLSIIFSLICFYADPEMEFLVGEFGLQKSITQLLQLLSGFFIAALAAIATFSRTSLDEVMSGHNATLQHSTFTINPEILTRRRFLTFMFGYLSLSTIMLYLALSLTPIGTQIIWNIINPTPTVVSVFSWLAFTIFSFWFFNILATTLIGLSFLTERIHRPEQTTAAKPKAAAKTPPEK